MGLRGGGVQEIIMTESIESESKAELDRWVGGGGSMLDCVCEEQVGGRCMCI